MSILIIGSGIGGPGTARLLARDGHDVTVLERDADAIPDSPHDAWDRWPRKGVAQGARPRSLSSRARVHCTITPVQNILRRRAVAEGIRAVGEARKGAPPAPLPGPTREQLLQIVS